MFKISHKDTRKTPERRQMECFGKIVNRFYAKLAIIWKQVRANQLTGFYMMRNIRR